MTIKQLIRELQRLEKKVPRGTPVVIEHSNFGKMDYSHDNFILSYNKGVYVLTPYISGRLAASSALEFDSYADAFEVVNAWNAWIKGV